MATGHLVNNNNNNVSHHLGTSLLKAIRTSFKNFTEDKCLFKSELISAFRALQLDITLSELDQLLAGACIAGKRVEADYLTCGEFALSAVELIKFKRVQQPNIPNAALMLDTNKEETSEKGMHYSVFLGGSCNPTTWRIKKAIPYLDKAGVTYYNPQVDDWYPELIQIEEDAKRNSTIKLFVFDSETRGIASLVETAFMASIGWRIVVILHYLSESNKVEIAGETLAKQEVKDLNRGRSFLCDILEKLGVPVFDNLDEALKLTCDVIYGTDSYERVLLNKKCTSHQYGDWLIQLRELFDKSCVSPEVRRCSVSPRTKDKTSLLSVKRQSVPDFLETDTFRSKKPSKTEPSLTPDAAITALEVFLQTRSLNYSIQEGLSYLDLIGLPIDYEVFCQFTAEAAYQHNNSLWNWGSSFLTNFFQHTYSLLKTALHPSFDNATDPGSSQEESPTLPEYDVFLGGTCANTTWRQELAIPLLEAHKISYYNPQLPQKEWTVRKMEEEHLAKQTSKTLLFIISKTSPSIASMTEAAYLITSSKSVFLTIEDIDPDSKDVAYPLTKTACKDYNRGRAYLKKTAENFNVPVFDTIEETLDSIVKYFCKSSS